MSEMMLLSDIPPEYSVALESAAESSNLDTLRVNGNTEMRLECESPTLIVQRIDGSECRPLDRVRALRKLAPDARLVVIGEGIDPIVGFGMGKLGVAKLIVLPTTSDELTRLCMSCVPSRGNKAAGFSSEVSDAMLTLRRSIHVASRSDATVLLTGETGCGKSVFAKEIHFRSELATGPFVHLNCSALSPELVESELFGHERGAFTGAVDSRVGRFEAAAGGTLFLDEIGEMDLRLQAKLLRVLEEREFERVGGTKTIEMTARVVAASNRDLFKAVYAGEFRSDLLFRLAVFHISVPALRDRPDDLTGLLEHKLKTFCERSGATVPIVSAEFIDRLKAYSWPGNIRELNNTIENIILRESPTELLPKHIDETPLVGHSLWVRAAAEAVSSVEGGGDAGQGFGESATGRDVLRDALIATGGNVSRAARRLNIPRSTLRYRIKCCDLTHLIPGD